MAKSLPHRQEMQTELADLQRQLQEVQEERDRLGEALDKTTRLIATCPSCRQSDIFPLFPGALDVPPENTMQERRDG